MNKIRIHKGAKFEYSDVSGLIGCHLKVEDIAIVTDGQNTTTQIYFKTGLIIGDTYNADLYNKSPEELCTLLTAAKATQTA